MPSKYNSGYSTDDDFFKLLLDKGFAGVTFQGEYANHLERNTKIIRHVAVVTKQNEKYVGAYVSLLDKYRNKGTEQTRQGYRIMRKALQHRLETKDTLRIPQQDDDEAADTEEEIQTSEEEHQPSEDEEADRLVDDSDDDDAEEEEVDATSGKRKLSDRFKELNELYDIGYLNERDYNKQNKKLMKFI